MRKVYLYRKTHQCLDGEVDYCFLSKRKLKLTKSGELACIQHPYNTYCTIDTYKLRKYKIRIPTKRVITERFVDDTIVNKILMVENPNNNYTNN